MANHSLYKSLWELLLLYKELVMRIYKKFKESTICQNYENSLIKSGYDFDEGLKAVLSDC